MEKVKSLKFSVFLSLIKGALFGIILTLVGTVVLAFVLKFVDLNNSTVSYINEAIKALSVFFVVLSVKKSSSGKLLIKSLFAGLLYAVISYLIFSIMNGGFNFSASVLYDVLFVLVFAVISAVILSLFNRKTI